MVLLFIVALTLKAESHDTHFDGMNMPFDPKMIEHNEVVAGGIMVKTDKGTWFIYKWNDFEHSQLHIVEVFDDERIRNRH